MESAIARPSASCSADASLLYLFFFVSYSWVFLYLVFYTFLIIIVIFDVPECSMFLVLSTVINVVNSVVLDSLNQ